MKSDTGVKTAVVCEYRGAPTTRLDTPQDYFMNTDTASLSFPTFLGTPQLVQCRDDDYIGLG